MKKKEEEKHKEKNKKEEGKGYDEFWLQYDQKKKRLVKPWPKVHLLEKYFKKYMKKK